jgi:glycosyltransferase involved in cell wall biosynthesis
MDKLAVVVPCFDEEKSLKHNIARLKAVIDSLIEDNIISDESFLYFVDDGSKDGTWNLILEAHNKFSGKIKGVKFTRNFGNPSAILAGIEGACNKGADCVITIDADLQQDETKIKDFVLKYQGGADIVYGIRNNRKTDNFLKKFSAELFYKFMNIMGVKLTPNHSEYRLMGKRALDTLKLYKESNMFIRGIFHDMGLPIDTVCYDVKKREHGTSKFNFKSLLKLAGWAITSFSVRPLRIVLYVGLIISMTAFLLGIVGLFKISYNSNLFTLDLFELFEAFISGIQILAIGIIGEYIGQILQEVKARPRHIVDQKLD